MLRFLARFSGLWLLAGALVALVVDGARTIAAAEMVTTPLMALWLHAGPASLEAMRLAVERSIHPWLWDPVLMAVLGLPGFAVMAGLGALLLWAGRKRRPRLPELDLR
jgi:hypothetical protein